MLVSSMSSPYFYSDSITVKYGTKAAICSLLSHPPLEATLLRSAAVVAARSAGFDWPVLLPVNDPLRDTFSGFVFRPASGRVLPLQADTRTG